MWAFLLVTSQRGHVFEFLTQFDGALDANPLSHFCGSKSLETKQSAASIEPLIDLLAYLELKLLPKNPIVPQNLVVRTKKKALEIWVRGFRWVSFEKGLVLLFFGCSIMTSLPGQIARIVAENFVVF